MRCDQLPPELRGCGYSPAAYRGTGDRCQRLYPHLGVHRSAKREWGVGAKFSIPRAAIQSLEGTPERGVGKGLPEGIENKQ